MLIVRLFLFTLLLLAVDTPSTHSQDVKVQISSQEETAQDVAAVPCKDTERLEGVKALFIKMGAPSESILVDKSNGVENVVVRIPGKAQGTIIVGAHYDKVTDGCGALDNWTGIVALAHIYRTLKDMPMQKTITFVAFGKEEKGLLGSKAMAKTIQKEELGQYCAMINIDTLGMAAPQALENLSSKPLVDRVRAIAERMKIPFNKVTLDNALADSVPFKDKKIPAVTISAVGNGWEEILHSRNDQVAKVNGTSVYYGYRLALALAGELDELPCEISRGDSKSK
jgi:Zn-dependent M28 family amino/carboxypeptidase